MSLTAVANFKSISIIFRGHINHLSFCITTYADRELQLRYHFISI